MLLLRLVLPPDVLLRRIFVELPARVDILRAGTELLPDRLMRKLFVLRELWNFGMFSDDILLRTRDLLLHVVLHKLQFL